MFWPPVTRRPSVVRSFVAPYSACSREIRSRHSLCDTVVLLIDTPLWCAVPTHARRQVRVACRASLWVCGATHGRLRAPISLGRGLCAPTVVVWKHPSCWPYVVGIGVGDAMPCRCCGVACAVVCRNAVSGKAWCSTVPGRLRSVCVRSAVG